MGCSVSLNNSFPLNKQVIGDLRVIMGNDFSLLIQTFVKDSAVRLADLERALSAGDADAFRRSAHSFKGSAGNLGAQTLMDLCRQLEILGAEDRLADAPTLMPHLRDAYVLAEQALLEMN